MLVRTLASEGLLICCVYNGSLTWLIIWCWLLVRGLRSSPCGHFINVNLNVWEYVQEITGARIWFFLLGLYCFSTSYTCKIITLEWCTNIVFSSVQSKGTRYKVEYMSRKVFRILRSLEIHLTIYERSKDTDFGEIAVFDYMIIRSGTYFILILFSLGSFALGEASSNITST